MKIEIDEVENLIEPHISSRSKSKVDTLEKNCANKNEHDSHLVLRRNISSIATAIIIIIVISSFLSSWPNSFLFTRLTGFLPLPPLSFLYFWHCLTWTLFPASHPQTPSARSPCFPHTACCSNFLAISVSIYCTSPQKQQQPTLLSPPTNFSIKPFIAAELRCSIFDAIAFSWQLWRERISTAYICTRGLMWNTKTYAIHIAISFRRCYFISTAPLLALLSLMTFLSYQQFEARFVDPTFGGGRSCNK